MEKIAKPIKEGLFDIYGSGPDDIRLIGGKCLNCNEYFFPIEEFCPNCCQRSVEQIFLSNEGVLKTFSVIRQTAPEWKGPVPYIIGVVMLPEGVEITTHLTNCKPEEVIIGKRVRLTWGKLKDDDQGNEIIIHKYRFVD